MSLYRQAGRARRNRRMAALAAAAVVVIAVVVVVLASSGGGPPSHSERVASARSAASEALDGVELLTVEYGQAVRGGRVVAATEFAAAKADVQRARQSLTDHRSDFESVDPGGYRRATQALETLAATVAHRSDIAAPVGRARAALTPFTRG
jgi:hypothetical protein